MKMTMVVILGMALILAGCAEPLTTREQVTLAGAAVGAGTGIILGHASGHSGAGAIIGGVAGAVGGALIGDAMQSAEHRGVQGPPPQQVVVAPPPPPPQQVVMAPPPPQQVIVVPPPRPVPVVVAPPPPPVMSQPQMVWVPEWRMYVLEGYDIAYYDRAYYYYHGDHWWISQSHAGPWAIIHTPPPMISRLPPGHFHSHLMSQGRDWCPPGLARQGRC